MRGALRIHEADNVATAIADIAPGEALFADRDIRAAVAVERGHKIALAPIARGEAVTKYGFSIGTATADIAPGEHVHSHNLATRSEEHTYELQSLMRISYAVLCLHKKKHTPTTIVH